MPTDRTDSSSGYLPLIVYLGMSQSNFQPDPGLTRTGYTYSEPRPSLFKYYHQPARLCTPLTITGCSRLLPKRRRRRRPVLSCLVSKRISYCISSWPKILSIGLVEGIGMCIRTVFDSTYVVAGYNHNGSFYRVYVEALSVGSCSQIYK